MNKFRLVMHNSKNSVVFSICDILVGKLDFLKELKDIWETEQKT